MKGTFGEGWRFGLGFWLAGIFWGLLPGIIFWTAIAGLIGMATPPGR